MERRVARDEKSFRKVDIYKKDRNEFFRLAERRKRRKAF